MLLKTRSYLENEIIDFYYKKSLESNRKLKLRLN